MLFDFVIEIFTRTPSPLYLNMVLLGGFIVFFGLVSLFVKERLYLTEALCATAVGIAFGPKGLGVVDLPRWLPDEAWVGYIMEFSRYVLLYSHILFRFFI